MQDGFVGFQWPKWLFPQMLLELSEYIGKQHYAQKEAYMPYR